MHLNVRSQQKRHKQFLNLRGGSERRGSDADPIDLTGHEEPLALLGDALSIRERSTVCKFQRALTTLQKECSRTSIVKHVSDRLTNGSYNLQPRHFCGILQNRWIEDTVVDAYLLLLRDFASRVKNKNLSILDTYVFPLLRQNGAVDAVSRKGLVSKWFAPTIRYYYTPVLINGNHWISMTFDVVKMRVYIYDSLRFDVSYYRDYLRPAIRGIACLHHERDLADFMNAEVAIVAIKEMPRQTNNRDCGVYMLAHARSICERVSVERVSLGEDVERYGRRRLMLSLHECRVS
eukprot:gene15429-18263_t